MNIFLLGNGFDLHYLLPTRYADFLNTIDYLCKHQSDPINTVGDVFRELSKDEKNTLICESYDKYGSCYDSTILTDDEITGLVSVAEKNKWFRYFVERKIKGDRWIDFEKEIKRVLSLMETIFKYAYSSADPEAERSITPIPIQLQSDIRALLIVFKLGDFGTIIFDKEAKDPFNRFFVPEKSKDKIEFESIRTHFHLRFPSGEQEVFYFRNDLHITYPEIPQIISLNQNMIVNELLSSLQELSRLLASYLNLFIERPLKLFAEKGIVELDGIFKLEAIVVSLNYTNTFEALYYDSDATWITRIINGIALSGVSHIHGKTYSSIVLGIDSDAKDELNELDTKFLGFKKYYQRVIYKTDSGYLSILQKTRGRQDIEYDLFVFGHSLDETDREIIMELFDLANTITIFYLDQNELENYVRRLVSIYGKTEFDRIRISKELTFYHTNQLNMNWSILRRKI